jgi:ABC-type nitrate/sulfonate/bicarbonate transport system substrate-binding protein
MEDGESKKPRRPNPGLENRMMMRTLSLGSTLRRLAFSVVLVVAVSLPAVGSAQELTKVPFPYGPLGLNSLPWVVAKEARFFEKNRLDVDMVYVGASAVIVQSMLSGSANIAGFGGPAVVTNERRKNSKRETEQV